MQYIYTYTLISFKVGY